MSATLTLGDKIGIVWRVNGVRVSEMRFNVQNCFISC